ncbi:MAG: short-chain dehydrogenase [Gammaproteobacteria bacterium]|nr:MAG: short-chain dehydrogenase [Gammaproteobacteria bacterium]
MATVLVTGCNRGIGLELCRQYHARGDDVIGVCRNSNPEVNSLGIRIIEDVDVSTTQGVATMSAALADVAIDIVVNNAGILRSDTLDTIDFDAMLEQYRVNTIGPLRVILALRNNLGKGAKFGILSSRVGSIEDNSSGNNYGYRCSKAAANMVGMNLRHDLAAEGVAVALLHPGLVATDMTGGRGVTTEKSAQGLIARMDELTMETSGSFWHAEGYTLPW